MSNSLGAGFRTTREADLSAYDRLPPTARKAIANAAFDWAASPIRKQFEQCARGFRSGPDIAKTVQRWDRNKHIEHVNADKVAPTRQGGRIW